MKTLVIVESPAKCKTISKYLGKDYTLKASFGHIRDLPPKELGVDIDNNFQPTYVNMPEKSKIIKELKSIAKESDEILLASDPDREGEAIAWHLNHVLKSSCKNIKRITFNEITKPSVIAATQNKRDVDLDLVNSQQTRRILDRVVGYKLSPWLNKIITSDESLSAGRVQSVTLKIIVLRENEILNFKKEEYWQITATLTNQNNEQFTSELFALKDEKLKIPTVQDAQNILNNLKNATYTVEDVKKQEKKRNPYPPFTTSTLQQEGNKKLNWDSTKVMKVAQELYEGVEVEDGQRYGLITYMRTDSVRVNEDFQKETLNHIAETFGREYVPSTPNNYKTKGEAQDAHEAIRPTVIKNVPEKIKDKLTPDQYLLYKLIYERFVASQMINATMDTVSVVINANDYKFKTTGQTVKFDGFLKLYNIEKEEDDEKEENKKVPNLNIGEILNLISIEPKQKFTSPPARYTEASLIKELEKLGIGRPSTYATIVQTLKKRHYVKINNKKFEPTKLGFDIVNVLEDKFTNIMDIKFTADMETQLDTIADGKEEWTTVISDFLVPFLNRVSVEEKELYEKMSENNQICPDCGKPMQERMGKYGKFWGCTGYPECKKIINIKEEKTSDVVCDKCGKPMIVKEYNKKYFLACTGYPDCRNTINCDKNGKPLKSNAELTDQICPDCGKPMYLRKGSTGQFYGCSGYPDCKKTLPYIDPKEKTRTCPDCGKPMRLRTGAKGKFWGCTGYPECTHTEPEK